MNRREMLAASAALLGMPILADEQVLSITRKNVGSVVLPLARSFIPLRECPIPEDTEILIKLLQFVTRDAKGRLRQEVEEICRRPGWAHWWSRQFLDLVIYGYTIPDNEGPVLTGDSHDACRCCHFDLPKMHFKGWWYLSRHIPMTRGVLRYYHFYTDQSDDWLRER